MKLMVQHNLSKALKEPEKSLEIFKSTADIVLKQIDNLNDIATSFSNFANLPTPKMEIYDFTQVITETYQLFLNSENHILIKLNIPNSEFLTIGDKKLMQRIIHNLMLNAIQSVEYGKMPIIVLELTQHDQFLIFSILDNGKGIPLDIHDKIFQPNFSTKFNGSGIGLAIAKNGVEFFGGKIWFVSSENVGTKFYIKLPLVSSKL
jgi:nitrogen fixation/metabolism regulation signal transduction histidine kinase